MHRNRKESFGLIAASVSVCLVVVLLLHFSFYQPHPQNIAGAAYTEALVFKSNEGKSAQRTYAVSIPQNAPAADFAIDISALTEQEKRAALVLLGDLKTQNYLSSFSIKDNYIAARPGARTGIINIEQKGETFTLFEETQSYIVQFKAPPVLAAFTEETQSSTELTGFAVAAGATEETYVYALQAQHAEGLKDMSGQLEEENIDKTLDAEQSFYYAFNGVEVEMTAMEATIAARSPYVERIVPNRKVTIDLQESVQQVGALQLWNLDAEGNDCATSELPCLRGTGVKIGIIDTGVDYMHPDLGGCMGVGCKVVGGYDVINDDDDPMDDQGHGTHVAATAAGKGGDGDQQYEPAEGERWGVAPDATIYAYKVLDASGSGNYASVIAGIERAVMDEMDIISLSLGGPGTPDDPVSLAIDTAVDAGVLAVVAAGNSGPSARTIGAPGVARKALTVAAINKENTLASFSSRGPVIWGRGFLAKPDVAAPGVDVCAAQWSDWLDERSCGDDRIAISGTSMATPAVSGAAALLLQARSDITPGEAKHLLISTAAAIEDDTVFESGAGIVNISAAVQAPLTIKGDFEFGSTADDAVRTVLLRNTGNSPLTVDIILPESITLEGEVTNALSSSDETITLLAGEEKEIELTVATEDSGFFFGNILFVTEQQTYVVPYTFIMAATITATMPGEHLPSFLVVGEDGGELYRNGYEFTGNTATILVPPGQYVIYAVNFDYMAHAPIGDVGNYVLHEQTTVEANGEAVVTFALDEAKKHVIHPVDGQGNLLNVPNHYFYIRVPYFTYSYEAFGFEEHLFTFYVEDTSMLDDVGVYFGYQGVPRE